MRGIDPPESTYGSDRNGLIWAFLFARGQPGRPIDASDVVARLVSDAASAASVSVCLEPPLLVVERLNLIQEELGALVSEQTGRTLFTLTVVTVMALPINLVAGLFGMNVGGIPLAESHHGFAVVVATLTIATGVIAWIVSRRPRD